MARGLLGQPPQATPYSQCFFFKCTSRGFFFFLFWEVTLSGPSAVVETVRPQLSLLVFGPMC